MRTVSNILLFAFLALHALNVLEVLPGRESTDYSIVVMGIAALAAILIDIRYTIDKTGE